ncbi:MAG TPA: hypothetical protein VFH84_25090, partial [Amycolatopsis sp.]|nr:hypothetical protein [Amycolatopsis sp.]
MWFRRKEAASPPPPSSPPSPGPAALPVTRGEWRSVAPIQRVLGEHPLVNPVQRFSSTLTSWRSPAYLEPLGHRIGPAEPAGVIADLARPELPLAEPGPSRSGGASVQRVPAFEEPASPLVMPVVTAREAVPPLTTAAAVDGPPVRTVQAIASPAEPSAVEPSVVEQSVVDVPAEVAESEPVVPLPTPSVAAESTPAPEPEPVELPVVRQPTPRRLGLGAPILPSGAQPSTSVAKPVQRLDDASPPPVNAFRPLETPEIRSGTTEPPGPPGGSTSVSAAPPLPVERGPEALPVARVVEGAADPVAGVRGLDAS